MTQARNFKNSIYEHISRLGRAVASPKRIELLDLLAQGPRTVEALGKAGGLSLANASKHLQVLRAARLVEAEKHGIHVQYRLASPGVAQFVRSMRVLAENRLVEIEKIVRDFIREQGGFEEVNREELVQRVKSGSVTVLDVRPREEFCYGHIPGAISVPLADLENRLKELPPDREVIAYCRGPYCVLAIEAVALLRTRGYRAFRLDMGVVDWKAKGLRVVREPLGA